MTKGKRRGWKRMRKIGSTQYGELFLDVTNFGEIGLLVFNGKKCRDVIWWDNDEQAIQQLLRIFKELGKQKREMAQNLVKFNILISLEKLRGILADLVDGVCELAWCEYVNRTSYMVNIHKKDSELLVEDAAKRILKEVIVVKPDES